MNTIASQMAAHRALRRTPPLVTLHPIQILGGAVLFALLLVLPFVVF